MCQGAQLRNCDMPALVKALRSTPKHVRNQLAQHTATACCAHAQRRPHKPTNIHNNSTAQIGPQHQSAPSTSNNTKRPCDHTQPHNPCQSPLATPKESPSVISMHTMHSQWAMTQAHQTNGCTGNCWTHAAMYQIHVTAPMPAPGGGGGHGLLYCPIVLPKPYSKHTTPNNHCGMQNPHQPGATPVPPSPDTVCKYTLVQFRNNTCAPMHAAVATLQGTYNDTHCAASTPTKPKPTTCVCTCWCPMCSCAQAL